MIDFKTIKEKLGVQFSSRSYKKGTYGAGLTVAVIALAVVLSLFAGLLPDGVKAVDIDPNKVYVIGDTTKQVLAGLSDDVTLTVVAEPDLVDARIEKLLGQYAGESEHITLASVDPVAEPAKVSELNAVRNTILVKNESTGRSTYVSFDDIIVLDMYSYYYYGTAQETEFDGEGQLTSAVSYVTSQNNETVALLNGHGESELSATVTDRIDKLNIHTEALSLLLDGGVPDGVALVLINAPTSDIAEDEAQMLRSYLASGGGLLYVADYEYKSLPNLDTLLLEYGISRAPGYIADYERYYQNSPYYIFPLLNNENEITSGFDGDALVLMTESQGFSVAEPARDTIYTEQFMQTSESGQAVTEQGSTDGVYALGVTATETAADGTVSRVAAVGAESLISEQILASFPSLANADVFTNTVTWFLQDVENISIPAKSLAVTYNTVQSGALWSLLFVFLIPIGLIVGGLIIWNRRRKV